MKTINVSDETYEIIKDQLAETEKFDISCYDDFIGRKLFFRTVTYHILGKVTKRIGSFLQLEDAYWIAYSGRFMQFIQEGKADEVEPIGEMLINIESVTDIIPWRHKLLKEQK